MPNSTSRSAPVFRCGRGSGAGLGVVVSLCTLLLTLAPEAALAVFTSGNNARTLTHDSELRAYNVYAPPSYDGLTAVPLVVDIHGLTSDASQQQLISGWQTKADTEGFLVVYPDGLDNSWNAGICCATSTTNGVDDVGFIVAMVTAIETEGNVDSARVYATGLSNGGAMTQRLACEAADVFAAAAPLAFPVPFDAFATGCTPSQEIPVLMSMGRTDVLVPYAGNAFLTGAVESYEAWRKKNTCGSDGSREHVQLGGSDCILDPTCANGTEVGLCSIRGSALAPPFEAFSGHILYTNDDSIVMADVIWGFFATGGIDGIPVGIPSIGGAAWLALASALAGVGARLRRGRRLDRTR